MPRTIRSLLVATLVAAVVAACGADDSSTTDGTVSPPATGAGATPTATTGPAQPSPVAEGTVIVLRVSGGEVTGADARVPVPLGGEVTIRVTADVDDEIHVHGYDLHQDVAAGEQASVSFTADVPGIFEVELEDAGLPLVSLEVQ